MKKTPRALGPISTVLRRTTLADVAQKARVHSATASQVLNHRENCWASEATKQRIRRAAEILGYRPNLAARALRSGRTHVIGFVATGFSVGFSHSRADGLTTAAAKSDYTVTLSAHPNDSESEDFLILRLLDRDVDGLAVYPVDRGPHHELRNLAAAGFPVVTFDGAARLDFECDDVSADYAEVGRLQARHLLRIGRRRICLANTIPEAGVNVLRESSVRQELARAGAPPPLEMRVHYFLGDELMEAERLVPQIRAFLRKHRGNFDAVVGFDSMASLVIRVLQELGLRVPEDVAVAGAGDSMLATYGVVPLTSVSTHDDVAGARAFDLLMDRILGRRRTTRFRRLTSTSKLNVRTSTRVPDKKG